VLHDVAKNEFTLAARIASVDQAGDVFAADELEQHGKLSSALAIDRREIEPRRNDR
jgi:hypothetical protein